MLLLKTRLDDVETTMIILLLYIPITFMVIEVFDNINTEKIKRMFLEFLLSTLITFYVGLVFPKKNLNMCILTAG